MHPDWKNESVRLDRIIEFISSQLKTKLSDKEVLTRQEADINRSMWEESRSLQNMENISDFMQYIGMLKQNMAWAKLTAGDIVSLQKLLYSPYFGRIDFAEDGGNPDRIYIGINSLTDDDTSEILIYDWRAPICSMFYDFETGPADYLCPAGLISGEITLKRQYRIENGRLIYLFDSNIAIGDQILQEILASGAGSKMRSIVSTIQKEQNAAIRNETSRVLAIQGAAGSGKTSVALHRASYLLYRHKKHIRTENLVILSSTDILGNYISNVLPELGEDEINGITFRHILQKHMAPDEFRIQSHPEYMEQMLKITNSASYDEIRSVIRFKTSTEFIGLINRFFDYALKYLFQFEDLVFKGNIVATGKELNDLFYIDFSKMLPAARLKRMEKRIDEMIKPLKTLQQHDKERELEADDSYLSHKEARVLSHIALKNDIKPFQDQMQSMFSVSALKLYRMLFEDDRILPACLDGMKLPDPQTLGLIRRYTLENIQSDLIGFEDAGPILYLSLLLGEIAEDPSVRHLIVDEAQDYSHIQLIGLSQLFPGAGITILGDISQNVSPYASEGNLQTSARLVSPGDYKFLQLNKSYRSTYEINEFAANFLGSAQGEFFGRYGEKPEVTLLRDRDELYEALQDCIKERMESGDKTIAVITRTLSDGTELYQILRKLSKNSYPLRMMQEDNGCRIDGAMIIPSYLAKGLEFDTVLIPIMMETDYSNPDEKGLFYTALTRPLHHLSLFCPFNKLPAVLDKIDPSHYNCMDAH